MIAADSAPRLAGLVHEIFRDLQAHFGDPMPSDPWPCESPELREITTEGVRRVLADPDLTPEEHHDAWCAAKRERGWTWGPEKDWEKKTHPFLRPLADLPERVTVMNRAFIAIVRTVAEQPEVMA